MGESGEVSVDIGAGWAESLIDRARKHPERMYIALEPRVPHIRRLPKNFHFVIWETVSKGLPLSQNSLSKRETWQQ